MDGTITTLLYASVAAAVAALGPLPWVFHREPSVALLGFANALAAGMMLGAAYILTAEAATAFDELTRSGRDDELVRQIARAWPGS